MNKHEIHTLIIPDIHGRIFWKNAIKQFPKEEYPNLPIIFLGDYLDPYPFENISWEDTISNFKDIIDIAKEDNRIHLLIGNHDMHYFYETYTKVRFSYKYCKDIKNMFESNFDLFNVAYEEFINNEKYLYTHAGVTLFWLRHLHLMGKLAVNHIKEKKLTDEQLPFAQMLETMTPDADKLNKMLHNYQGLSNLWMISLDRGGDDGCGSCIWADLYEFGYKNSTISGLHQIFAHNLAYGGFDGVVIDNEKQIAMLDSRKAWVIDNLGNLESLENVK